MSEVTVLNLQYLTALNQAYQNLSSLPGFVLLQSLDKQRGRYDILSAYPYDRIDPSLDSMNRIRANLPCIASTNCKLPFQGGAIGYFSYDFATNQANILSNKQPGLKDVPEAVVGFYDWAIIVDHRLQKVSLISANSQKNTSQIVEEIKAMWQNSATTPRFIIESSLQALVSKDAYKKAFHAIHTDIMRGRCYQVNYTQPFHLDYSGSTWGIYDSISRVNPVPYAAFMHYDDFDILSFSPERLMTIDEGQLLASPIKGTKPRSKNPKEDEALALSLQICEKNRAENVMIVDLLRNDFGKIAKAGSVKVSALCQVESYEAVHHLVSHIEAQCLDDISPLDAFLSCFPGGSITGAPKRESMHVIAEQEPFARGIYCGSIGYISNHGRLDMNIAIRTITASQNTLHLAAGGALVIDSNWKDEYDECFTKLKGILRGLNI